MTIFDILDDILFTKKGNLLKNVDEEGSFNNYMVNRWISMHSPSLAIVINNTGNWLWSIFETKQEYYKFINTIIPCVARKRIHYIKRAKPEDKPKEIENIELIAKRLELSQREIKSYYEYSSEHSASTARANTTRG